MGVRDDEITRLLKYAQGLNVKVLFKKAKKGSEDAASWRDDGKEIIIYTKKRQSKIDIILSLVHELGHHCWYIHDKDRVENQELLEADLASKGEGANKTQRKVILDAEEDAAKWWDVIYKDVDLKFPINKMHYQRDLDLFVYQFYYENDRFPLFEDYAAKKKESKKKWGIR